MKPRKIFKHIEIDMYNRDLLFTAGTTKKEVINWFVKKGFVADELEALELGSLKNENSARFIFIGNALIIWVKDLNDIPSIAHEVFHLVYFLGKNIGAELTDESEEFYAYLTGYMMKKILC